MPSKDEIKAFCAKTIGGVRDETFIQKELSKALLQFTNEQLRKVSEKASQPNANIRESSFAKFQGAVGRVQTYIRDVSGQHRVQQFFTQGKIGNKLSELHTDLGESYTALTNERYSKSYDKQAKDAEKDDLTSINDYIEGIGGDVTKIVQILGCDDPPKDVMSALRKRVNRMDVGPAFPLLKDFIKWIDRDWFWLTFTCESRQEIKGPLTRVVKGIIPAIRDDLPNDDRIALTSDELTSFAMVDRLFAVLDNSGDRNLVESFRSALAETSLRDKLKDVDF